MSTVFVMVCPHKGAPIPKEIRDFRNKVHVWMEGALGMKLAKIASDHPNEIFSKERGMLLINCNTTSNDSDPSHVYVYNAYKRCIYIGGTSLLIIEKNDDPAKIGELLGIKGKCFTFLALEEKRYKEKKLNFFELIDNVNDV